eukprot:7444692-Karenia_brevis.AAC.1
MSTKRQADQGGEPSEPVERMEPTPQKMPKVVQDDTPSDKVKKLASPQKDAGKKRKSESDGVDVSPKRQVGQQDKKKRCAVDPWCEGYLTAKERAHDMFYPEVAPTGRLLQDWLREMYVKPGKQHKNFFVQVGDKLEKENDDDDGGHDEDDGDDDEGDDNDVDNGCAEDDDTDADDVD